jgi:hypothetical protein
MKALTQLSLYKGAVGVVNTLGQSAKYMVSPLHFAETLSTTEVDIIDTPATIGGRTLNAGDEVVLTGQSVSTENGPWVFISAGLPLVRPAYFAAATEDLAFNGLSFVITGGVEVHRRWSLSTSGSVTIDVTPITINRSVAAHAADLAGIVQPEQGGTGVGDTPANGELLIGNGSGFTLATLTEGKNITITQDTGSITIEAAPCIGFSDVELTQDYAVNDIVTVPPYTVGSPHGANARLVWRGMWLVPGANRDYVEVGTAGSVSTQIQTKRPLLNGSVLTLIALK